MNKENEKITAKCDECKKEMTGTRDFLRGLGWELRRNNSTLCLNCRFGDDFKNRRPRGGGGRNSRRSLTFSR
jgi:hypothetical protein